MSVLTQCCVQLEHSAVTGQIFPDLGKHMATVTLLGVKADSLWAVKSAGGFYTAIHNT